MAEENLNSKNAFFLSRLKEKLTLDVLKVVKIQQYSNWQTSEGFFLLFSIDHSENEEFWCATAVYSNKTVINGQWGDCLRM